MTWQEEFEEKLNNKEIQTDSDIEDFIEEKLPVYFAAGKYDFEPKVWQYFYQWCVRGTPCEGCIHAEYRFYLSCESECTSCSRRTKYKDNYERIDYKIDARIRNNDYTN